MTGDPGAGRRRTLAAVRKDLRLQWRQGLWFAYAFVCLSYICVLQLVGADLRGPLASLIVFSDPAVLGFFFIGGLMLLERGEGTLSAAFASPLRVDEWIAAKLLSLTLLALVASLAIALSLGPTHLHVGWMLAAVIPTSSCFILVGIIAGTRFSTVNRYLLGGGLASLPLMASLVVPLGLADSPVFALLPSGAALELLGPALGGPSPSVRAAVLALAVLTIWNVALWRWARAWMCRYVIADAA